jgi:small GTP-binding protein
MSNIEVMLLGDKNVGKTNIAAMYSNRVFYSEYIPSSNFDYFVHNSVYQKETVRLNIMDCPGAMDQTVARYALNSNILVMCYSMTDEQSLVNLKNQYCPSLCERLVVVQNIPIILCGTKSDLKPTTKSEIVSFDKSLKIAEEMRAMDLHVVSIIECSAKKNHGVKELFEEVIRRGLKMQQPKKEPNFTKFVAAWKPPRKSGIFASLSELYDDDDVRFFPIC